MKRIFLTLGLVGLLIPHLRGQQLDWGFRWGANYTKLTPKQSDWQSEGHQLNYAFGLYFHSKRSKSNHFIQPEITISKRGGSIRYMGETKLEQNRYKLVSGNVTHRNAYYADVALTIGYYLPNSKIRLYAGPMFSYKVGASQKGEGLADAWFSQALAPVVINYYVGAGFNTGRLGFDLRYERNFSSMGEILPNGHTLNDTVQNIQFTLSYQLNTNRGRYYIAR
ncbi:hypothetical protein BKI52_34645 [marine bacterium AO1-C]|nr:hypothetical protein BKI52_34645 [marine bacterium AO1-C]